MAGGTKRYIRDSDNESMRSYEHGGEVKEVRDQIATTGEFIKNMHKTGDLGGTGAYWDRVVGNMHKMSEGGTPTTQSGLSIRDPNYSWKNRNFHADKPKAK